MNAAESLRVPAARSLPTVRPQVWTCRVYVAQGLCYLGIHACARRREDEYWNRRSAQPYRTAWKRAGPLIGAGPLFIYRRAFPDCKPLLVSPARSLPTAQSLGIMQGKRAERSVRKARRGGVSPATPTVTVQSPEALLGKHRAVASSPSPVYVRRYGGDADGDRPTCRSYRFHGSLPCRGGRRRQGPRVCRGDRARSCPSRRHRGP